MMFDALDFVFSFICGQNPGHSWSPGGVLLPCCQRCTGLYVGAAIAAALHLWLKPRLSARFLQLHGGFLLLMVPFGFHWLPQGALVRTVTGVLFGCGLVTFLSLPLRRTCGARIDISKRKLGIYSVGLAATCVLLPLASSYGGSAAACALALMLAAGLVTLGLLVGTLIATALMGTIRLLCRFRAAGVSR